MIALSTGSRGLLLFLDGPTSPGVDLFVASNLDGFADADAGTGVGDAVLKEISGTDGELHNWCWGS